jgi:flagellar hook-associated protein 2
VDGIQSGSLTLSAGTYSGADLARELQSRINGDQALLDNDVRVSVAFDAATNKLAITSNRYGSASKVESITGTSAATLGLDTSDVAISGDGVDVAGTIGGLIATGAGRFLTAIGDASGLKIEVTGGSTGARGDLVFSRGYADQLDSLLTSFLQTNDLIKSRTDGLDTRIEDINDQREALERRLFSQEQRLRSQFAALDTLIGQLNSTSSFLTQQLSSLQTSFNSNSK